MRRLIIHLKDTLFDGQLTPKLCQITLVFATYYLSFTFNMHLIYDLRVP